MVLASSLWWSLTASLLLLLPAGSWADRLPAPTISADPLYDFYYEGEAVTIRCSAPTRRRRIGGFRFFRHRGEQIHQEGPSPLSFTGYRLTATAVSAGDYSCSYFVEDSGQELLSHESPPLTLWVRAAPTAPALTLHPQQEVYSSGSSIQLLCSFPSSVDDVREVQFYGDSGFAASIPVSNVKNYTYTLNVTGEEVSGSYSCTYAAFESNRLVTSQRSLQVVIFVQRSFRWLREVLVGGSFFIINGLIFFIFYCLKKSGGGRD